MHAFTDRFQRRPIHTCTKFLVHQGILPAQYLAQLSRSQVSRYRNLDFDRYFGNDLFRFSDQVMTITRQAAQNDFDRKMMQAYLRLALTFRSIFVHARHFHHTLHMHREKVVEAVQRVGDTISVDDCARLLGVATSTLRNWITQVRVRCSDSLINLCRKVHPNQLLGSEVEVMKELLSDNRLRFWPSVSVYYHALRTQSVSMAKSTWYKYAAMLNIRRLKPKRSHKYGQGIRASKPNQYWHADVTYFKSGDGLKHYIYTVVDNFSRFPLCVHLSTQLSGAIRSMTFRMALQKAMEYHPNLQTINLVVDGGPENINTNVEVFIKEVVHIPIHRIRALKDVAFSNSMAEAFNKTLKCYYLNHQAHPDTQQLDLNLKLNVEDFAMARPHSAIKGLTPLEAYTCTGPDLTLFHAHKLAARQRRVDMNSKYGCGKCSFSE